MRYLLDTTLIADHANGFEPAMRLLARLYAEGADLLTCDVVTCEALSGGTDEHLRAVARVLESLEYVATSPNAARWAAAARLKRHRAGGKLGLGDSLMAGVAAELGATVVTRNRPDFERQGIDVLGY
ncbi:MAG TPA: type II toxin-antitoxin system VapC family toxin [Candidatus Limnocylindria bacterium]|nr:type II toxin-antitoxin system VapC family toxin [Candidatus Limnocylindria bacterium]